MKVNNIHLKEYQLKHFEKVCNILQNELSYLDTSETGSGKTIISMAIASLYDMGVLVFCPKTAITNWKNHCKKYKVKLYDIMTYDKLRGKKKSGIKHDLLIRDGNHFFPTEKLREYGNNGLLVIFDECHALKNNTAQNKAAHAISKECKRLGKMGYNVRVSLLSATPATEKENIENLFKIMGIIIEDKLTRYNKSSRLYEMVGLRELIDKCNSYDKNMTFHTTCRPLNKTTVKSICHDLFTRILRKKLTSGMPKPPIPFIKDAKNIYAKTPPEDVEQIKRGAMLFKAATNYNHQINEIDYGKINWGNLISSRREIDSGKVNTLVRLAKQELDKDPNCKVILFCNFTRDIEKTYELMKDYGAAILNGKVVKLSSRDAIINKFQEDSNEMRVLISHPKVGGTCINLQNSKGYHPRFTFILPSYFFTDQIQAAERTYRYGTKSNATIRFVYSKEFPFESSLLDSIAKKSKLMKTVVGEARNIIYPGEYESITEE